MPPAELIHSSQTITFGGTPQIDNQRQVDRVRTRGKKGGDAVSRSSGRSILNLTCSFTLISDGSKSADEKLWDFDTLVALYNKQPMILNITYTPTFNKSFSGKITSVGGARRARRFNQINVTFTFAVETILI